MNDDPKYNNAKAMRMMMNKSTVLRMEIVRILSTITVYCANRGSCLVCAANKGAPTGKSEID